MLKTTSFSTRFNRMNIADQNNNNKKKTKLIHSTNKIAFVCVYVCMCIVCVCGGLCNTHILVTLCAFLCVYVCASMGMGT